MSSVEFGLRPRGWIDRSMSPSSVVYVSHWFTRVDWIDLTVLVVVIPTEDWTRELFRVFSPRTSLFRFFFYYRRSSISFVFLLKFSRTVGVSPTLPRNPLLSGFLTTLYLRRSHVGVPSHVYRLNKNFAVLWFSI